MQTIFGILNEIDKLTLERDKALRALAASQEQSDKLELLCKRAFEQFDVVHANFERMQEICAFQARCLGIQT